MQVQDRPWEIENIGKRTVQLNYAKDDIYNSEEVCNAVKGYQYLVAKVPAGNISCLLGLQNDGFKMIETQLTIYKDKKSFCKDIEAFKTITDKTSFQEVKNDSDFNLLVDSVDDGMFSTDRVSLDPSFGLSVGRHRYVGWMKNEYKAGTSSFWWITNDNEKVGFMILKEKDNKVDLLLNGLFTPFQGKGFGIITPASPLLLSMRQNNEISEETTNISSNNVRVVHLYNKLNFKLLDMTYVLVASTPTRNDSLACNSFIINSIAT